MDNEITATDGIVRRTVLRASAAVAGALALSGTTVADEDDEEVDEPEGFDVEIVSDHAPFADDVASTFEVTYDDAEDPSSSNWMTHRPCFSAR
ncbi:hypothetical protein QA600_17945 [Natronococcus sp. A-GB1]|uniref:hypothetical protein n=1 Tax=Natronococcus sp. A-GB1 TaxID=3037648 RepID=UPI0024202880|nr:hypothetical protein [Natronococcus sp. A-GB1]MDG5761214.1 hypothetical protein [Natronococcus sp. A-GB1]